jgi:hypothetical protein
MEKMDIVEEKVKKAVQLVIDLKKENEVLKLKLKELEALKVELEKFRQKRDRAKVQVEEILDTIDKIQLDLKF